MASLLAVIFFAIYLANGIFILSNRPPADPARLQLWLSGGMVLYALYHLTRCAWTQRIPDLELTDAESQWLGGAPIQRSSLAIYHLGNVAFASLLKTIMLVVVLAHDVSHVPLLTVGVFVSLLTLEIVRLTIQRVISGFDKRQNRIAKICSAAISIAVFVQIFASMAAATPLGRPVWVYVISGFQSIGQVASSGVVQILAMPWFAASQLAVTPTLTLTTVVFAAIAALTPPAAVVLLVWTDRWSEVKMLRRERDRLKRHDFITAGDRREQAALSVRTTSRWTLLLDQVEMVAPVYLRPSLAMMTRQWVSIKNYWASILASLLVPTLLSLSPLVTGQDNGQWLYVVGSIALYTMLLAPPALRIDFRRDLKRSILIRGLPMTPGQMVIGQTAMPAAITIAFQVVTLSIAIVIVQPGWLQAVLWASILSALAVFTFAIENALFLMYPHHEKAQGLSMIIRTKLTFLGKGSVILLSLGALLLWSAVCRRWLAEESFQSVFVSGSIVVAWAVALASVALAAHAWHRFDLADDIPPE